MFTEMLVFFAWWDHEMETTFFFFNICSFSLGIWIERRYIQKRNWIGATESVVQMMLFLESMEIRNFLQLYDCFTTIDNIR